MDEFCHKLLPFRTSFEGEHYENLGPKDWREADDDQKEVILLNLFCSDVSLSLIERVIKHFDVPEDDIVRLSKRALFTACRDGRDVSVAWLIPKLSLTDEEVDKCIITSINGCHVNMMRFLVIHYSIGLDSFRKIASKANSQAINKMYCSM